MNLATAVGWTPMQAKLGVYSIKFLFKKCRPMIIATVCAISSIKIYSFAMKKWRRRKWAAVDQDVVVLHSFPRGKLCPNASPFVMKLEAYLRLSDIPYQFDFDEPMGSKGKSPWITLNGQEYTDSQLIIEMLTKKYNKNLSSHLSDEDQAIARAFLVMADEQLYWSLINYRYVMNGVKHFLSIINLPIGLILLYPLIRYQIKRSARAQGLGRHSHDEIKTITNQNLKALSVYLGNKPYLMGDKPCEVDCSVFGFLAQIKWTAPDSSFYQTIQIDYPNLVLYCDRVKERIWPDWDQCIEQTLITNESADDSNDTSNNV